MDTVSGIGAQPRSGDVPAAWGEAKRNPWDAIAKKYIALKGRCNYNVEYTFALDRAKKIK